MEIQVTSFSTFRVAAAGGQWVGKRENQEDSFLLSPSESSSSASEVLALLADGMGGEDDGEIASASIIKSFSCAYAGEFKGLGGSAIRLEKSVQLANSDLAELKMEGRVAQGAGATLIALSIRQEGISLLSIGDSLLYRQRGTEIIKLNNAHTWGWELERRVASGQMTAAAAAAEKGARNALYAVVCGEEIPAADKGENEPCEVGDRYIIASDGLEPLIKNGWGTLLNHPQVRKSSPAQVRNTLLAELKKIDAPHQDNATVIVIDILPHLQASPNCSSVSLLGDRDSQQDSEACWESPEATLAVVADGAGGHAGGEFASRTVVQFLHMAWRKSLSSAHTPKAAARIISEALCAAHEYLIKHAGGKSSLSGKSAVVVAYMSQGAYTVVNVGDCRAYISQGDKWTQLSVDDSLLRICLERGEITPEEARNHPDQSKLTQAIGAHRPPQPHVATGRYTKRSSMLLCCDGLWGQLPPELWNPACWFACAPSAYGHCLKAMAYSAVDAAEGKSDNVSALWIHPAQAPASLPWYVSFRKWLPIATALLSILVTSVVFHGCVYSPALQKLNTELTKQKKSSEARIQNKTKEIEALNRQVEELKKELEKTTANRPAWSPTARTPELPGSPNHPGQPSNSPDGAVGQSGPEGQPVQSPNTPAVSAGQTVVPAGQTPASSGEDSVSEAPASAAAQPGTNTPPATGGIQIGDTPNLELSFIGAANSGTAEAVGMAISHGVNKPITPSGKTFLISAIEYRNESLVEEILAIEADVNKADNDGVVPLAHAARAGYEKIVKRLLKAPGIDVNKKDKNGKSPRQQAVDKGKTKCAKLILDAGGRE